MALPSNEPATPGAKEDALAEKLGVPGTLWDFEEKIVGLMDELADLVPDGEVESEADRTRREKIEALVNDLISKEAGKVDATARVFRRFESYSSELSDESKRLAKRAKAFEGKRARLAGYLLDVMLRWGAKRLEGKESTFTRIQNADTVEVDDPATLPFEYQRVTFEFSPMSFAQYEELRAMLEAYQGRITVEAQKKPLLDLVKRVEKQVESAIQTGEHDANVEAIPDGVRLRPGSWRLALR